MIRCVGVCFVAGAIACGTWAEDAAPWSPIPPAQLLERPLAEVLSAKGEPASGGLDAAQARYRESWFGLSVPIDVDYLALSDSAKTMHQITLNFPEELTREAIIEGVSKTLGPGEQGPSSEDAPSVYFARWIRGGVRYDLQDFGDYIEMYVARARMDDPAKYGLPETAALLQVEVGNVVDDEGLERVMLVGVPGAEPSAFMERLYFIVLDEGEKADIFTPLPETSGSGYDADMALRDFTGDGLADVFVRAGTGGSGGIVNGLVYAYAGGAASKIFDTSENTPPAYSGELIDGYKATLTLPAPEQTIELDLSDRKAAYDEMGVYQEGVVAKATELWGEAYGWLDPVDADGDGVYELRVVQQVRATSNADRVAEIASVLDYHEWGWTVTSSEVTPLTAG